MVETYGFAEMAKFQETEVYPKRTVRITNVDSSGNNISGFVDEGNSTQTPLLSGQTFTGQATNITNYSAISLMVYADVNSANDGLAVEFSFDGVDWHQGEHYTIPAMSTKFFTPPKQGKYYRVVYTNNGVDQTEFHIHSLVSVYPIKWSSHNLKDSLNDDDDAELVASVLKLRTAQDTYVSGAATNSGNFKVSLEELESGVSEDDNSSLRVAPILIDEFGVVSRQLGDNMFAGAPVTITSEHHEIHCGDSYSIQHYFDLSNGATGNILIIVPNESGTGQDQKLYHFSGSIKSEAELDIYFYEGSTVSNNGTALTSYNRNRNSANTDTLGIYHTPTITSPGTLIDRDKSGSGTKAGGEVNRADEWVLKNNTYYILSVTNATAVNNWCMIKFNYYVHPGV